MMNKNEKTNLTSPSAVVYSLIAVAIMYSVLGTLVGLCWMFGTGSMNLPRFSILEVLALWWAWAGIFVPPIMFFVGYFKNYKSSPSI